MSVLLVEHNVDLVLSACDQVTVMASGRWLTTGPPGQVRDDPQVIEAYLGSSVRDSAEATGAPT
jgi:ABC-type branched-subunit amino acid transport system ATPase component